MASIKRLNPFLALLVFSCIVLLSVVNVEQAYAQDGIEACAVSPEQIDGQGFSLSSQGFSLSSQGFSLSSQGFSLSSFGFSLSSQSSAVAVIEEILNNPVTPRLLLDDLSDIITGSGFNSKLVYLLIVDDFSSPNAHGFKVRTTAEMLLSAIDANDGDPSNGPNITIVNVDIAPVDYNSSLVASSIANAVNSLPDLNNSHIVVNMSFGLVPCDDNTNPTLIDSESGESFTVTDGFNFDDYSVGPPEDRPFEKLSPVLECIVVHYSDDEDDSEYSSYRGGHHDGHDDNIEGYTAYFGYFNPNSYAVEIPIGSQNQFTGSDKDRGQPILFAPGRNSFIFSADFDNGNLIWKLGHKKAKAWKKSPVCEGEIPEPSPQIVPNGYSMTNYAVEQLGIPENFVDEYFEYLFDSAVEVETDPFTNIQLLMRHYLQLSHLHATDGDPNTNFALIPIASAGNFRTLLGGDALKPAMYPEVIATSASVGDVGIDDEDPITFWQLSHDGNILAPGVSVGLAFDAEGAVTDIGAGTSHSAPFVSVLSSLWLTYPSACQFDPAGLPPLTALSQYKDSNAFFTEDVLDCQFNLSPIINVTFEGSYIDENAEQVIGTVSDPNGDDIYLSTDSAGVVVIDKGDGTWAIIADDNTTPQGQQTIVVTVNDGRGGISNTSFDVEILNVPPTATLEVDKTTVDIYESAILTLINANDQSDVDEAAGFMYAFDCDISDEFTNEAIAENSYGCAYASAGTFAATATIIDKDGGSTIYDVAITVESSEPEACYASSVVSFDQGKRRNGSNIPAKRSDPEKALGAPQDSDSQNYVSLGFAWHDNPAGSIILSFDDYNIMNLNGTEPDIRIWETTYRDNRRPWYWYPEKVEVYASNDGESWIFIGTTSDKDQAYDLGSLDYANLIKLVDVTNRWRFGRYADAFDVDAVEGFDCDLDEHYEE